MSTLSSTLYRVNTYVGGNVSGDITTLGLNDRKGSEGSSTELVVHLRSTLEETRVEVEDITGVGLTTGRTTEKEGHLTVSDGLLGQVIVDDESWKKSLVQAQPVVNHTTHHACSCHGTIHQ